MIINLKEGEKILSTRFLTDHIIRNWKYGHQSSSINGSFMTGSEFKIAEISKVPGHMWIKVEMPGSDPVKYIKISGEEYAHNFKKAY